MLLAGWGRQACRGIFRLIFGSGSGCCRGGDDASRGGDSRSHHIDAHKDAILAFTRAERDATIEGARRGARSPGLVSGFGTPQRFFRREKIKRRKRSPTLASKPALMYC